MKMDGKNREEQENGAKVRDLEEYKAENRKRKRKKQNYGSRKINRTY